MDSAKSSKVKKERVKDWVHLTLTEKIGARYNRELLLIRIPDATHSVRNRLEIVTRGVLAHSRDQKALHLL